MTVNYQFDPTKFGFLPPEQTPAVLKHDLHTKSYVKVTGVLNGAFWYTSCNQYCNTDERWCFHSGVWSPRNRNNDQPHTIYSGCITSDEYAEALLMHLLGTATNKGTLKYGKERLTKPSLKTEPT